MLSKRWFTTGAFVEPLQLKDGTWVWYVTGFEDDTFDDNGEEAEVMGGVASCREGLHYLEEQE